MYPVAGDRRANYCLPLFCDYVNQFIVDIKEFLTAGSGYPSHVSKWFWESQALHGYCRGSCGERSNVYESM